MSYIGEPFKYDVSASDSHGDPKGTGTSQFKRYSQGFLRELATELKAHPTFGAELRIFFDDCGEPGEGLDPNSGLTEQLRTAMGQAAILTVLMSDHHLRSKWCADERDFRSRTGADLGVSSADRLALADERGNPLVGTCFYDPANTTMPWPFAWPGPARTRKAKIHFADGCSRRLVPGRFLQVHEPRRSLLQKAALCSLFIASATGMAGETPDFNDAELDALKQAYSSKQWTCIDEQSGDCHMSGAVFQCDREHRYACRSRPRASLWH